MNNKLEIVILCNKEDFYFTRICVSSIRYFYPNIKISLVKDLLNGNFNTNILEKKFNVEILDLGLKNYGWCTGKIALILNEKLAGKKYLLLDSDIVFIGKVIDKLELELEKYDFIISPEFGNSPDTSWFKRTYYDIEWAKKIFPEFNYPGFTFNCGQMVISPGIIKPFEIKDYIVLDKFPYWTKESEQNLPCRDQSLLNILYPLKNTKKELRLGTIEYQLWSENESTIKNYPIDEIKGSGYPFLIHWAGALRIPLISQMTRNDILDFFQSIYFEKIGKSKIQYRLYKAKCFMYNKFKRLKEKIRFKA